MQPTARSADRSTGAQILAAISLLTAGLLAGAPAAHASAKEYGVWFWSSPAATPFATSQSLLDAAKAAGFTAPLTGGTDAPIVLSPFTDDVTIHEI